MCGYGRRLQDFESGNVYASALVEMGNILISRIFKIFLCFGISFINIHNVLILIFDNR